MGDAGLVDRMQVLAAGPTQKLYFDASETQSFFLYNTITQTAQMVSSPTARANFESGNFSWTLPGVTAWNHTDRNLGNNASIQTNPPPAPILFIIGESELGGPDVLG